MEAENSGWASKGWKKLTAKPKFWTQHEYLSRIEMKLRYFQTNKTSEFTSRWS